MDENSKVRRREEEQIEAEGEDSMSFEETRPAKRPLFLRHLCPYDERYMDDRRTKLEQEDEQDSEEEEPDDFDGWKKRKKRTFPLPPLLLRRGLNLSALRGETCSSRTGKPENKLSHR